mmetsp:Transcript_19885/g.24546  ORF Transcript_19885/g.24546 Transcript_19885/m.24546 type:complete len:531 (+) Transcript_19885:95-1687(+)|eukprot:CAMPEP_0172504954 /NCGR_PEP_ID=MMETSP1066-20121228/182462_1 /TAXON_ID=671091 /ORGANISM="Coscinodiscus wailesii, Strain CCMP2513" /LENGTH=530 /DNA_ID=CAMNT_0013281363 /DNA_START=88 /DNA_END=1680 /DNA_ORIENTATION=-
MKSSSSTSLLLFVVNSFLLLSSSTSSISSTTAFTVNQKQPRGKTKNHLPQPSLYTKSRPPKPNPPTSTSLPERIRSGATPPPNPTLKTLQKFYLPCLGLWIAGPLLSLADTSFVGLSGGASQLAALGPATTFFDGATYLFAFLNVATTNLYASAVEVEDAEGVVRTASRVSLLCGFMVMATVLAFCRPLLALYIGPKAAAAEGLLSSASDYVSIRAFSLPSSLLLGVLQSSLLGAKDSVTPLVAILYQTVINLVGDFICVTQLGMGIQGAALATLLAQWVSTIALYVPAKRKLLKGQSLNVLPPYRLASSTSARSFLKFAVPVLTLIIGKIAAFGFMTHAAAALPGQPVTLAAHQIVLSLFFFASPFLEVISQTAQTFLPAYEVDGWWDESQALGGRLLRIGCVVGGVVACVAASVPLFFSGVVTSDVDVRALAKTLAAPLAIGVGLTAPVAVSEGILLARRELKYLAGVYMASIALLPSVLLKVKMGGGHVRQVWWVFAGFQLFRALCFAGRIWGKKRVHDGAMAEAGI